MPASIVSVLPKSEGFSPDSYGAIALCVRDFTTHSQFHHSTTVISGITGQSFEGIDAHCTPPAPWFCNKTRYYARQCATIVHKKQAALVEVHNRPLLLRAVKSFAPTPRYVLHLHNDPREMKGLKTPRERVHFLENCEGVFCVSQFTRTCFLEGLPLKFSSRVHVVYNGLASLPFTDLKEPYIVFAGRLTQGKGGLLFAQALALCLPQLPEWKAVMIGGNRHSISTTLTPYEQSVMDALRSVKEQVMFRGFLPHPEVMDWFGRSAIAVVPSEWQEPFGRTALEAMAQSCAVISSGRGGLKEVTEDAAVTVGDLTPTALAQAIVMLAQNKAQQLLLRKKAHARAENFAIERVTAALDAQRLALLHQDASYAV